MKKFIDKLRKPNLAELSLCPLPTPLMIPEGQRVLVFAPHPDDEVLGCGGTLALLQQAGCEVRVVVVTDGGGAGFISDPDTTIKRKAESTEALSLLGISAPQFLDQPDGQFVPNKHLVVEVTNLIVSTRPDWLFIPSPLDYHRDHVSISEFLLGCIWKSGYSPRIFLYEIWCPLPITRVVNISTVISLKKAALACYRIPQNHRDYQLANLSLAAFRGLLVQGAEAPVFAEGFVELEIAQSGGRLHQTLLNLRLQLESLLGSS